MCGQQVSRDEEMNDRDLVKAFKALADITRQQIISLLAESEMNVTDICSEFNISQPTVSHHLRILRNCDLIVMRKKGKNIYYCICRETMDSVFTAMASRVHIRIERK